ncbi:MAG: hypothetical protein QNJ46_35060 [Leptolyngbyaceae cyanobacterium MO_188.B28]|nr:hypothetical protein [Leptolyngbyaceae cyanobacterium MO_188.B28]
MGFPKWPSNQGESSDTQQWRLLTPISEKLSVPLAQLRQLGQTYSGDKAIQAIDRFEKQISEISQGIHAGWRWTTQALSQEIDSVDIQNRLLSVLLPWGYCSSALFRPRLLATDLEGAYHPPQFSSQTSQWDD